MQQRYIKQNDPGCTKDLRRVGCFWRTGMHIAELLSGEQFERCEELNALWEESLLHELMKETPTGPILHRGIVPIIKLGLDYFGSPVSVAEVGTFSDGKMSYYQWYREIGEDLKCGRRFYVQKVCLDESYMEPYHYRLVSNVGKVLFDPYEPSPKADGIEYSIIIEEIL